MRPILIPLVVASLLSSLSAQVLKLNRGDIEFAGYGQFDAGASALQFRLGAYTEDYLQVGTNIVYQDSNFAERMAFNLFVLGLFETRTYILPYVGAALGYGTLDITGGSDRSGAEFYLLSGLKYYLADNVTLNTELHYAFGSSKTFLGNRKLESSEVSLRVGIGYVW
jgi:opacity protein-like surface antigen